MRINKTDMNSWIENRYNELLEDTEDKTDEELYQMATDEYYNMIDDMADNAREESRDCND